MAKGNSGNRNARFLPLILLKLRPFFKPELEHLCDFGFRFTAYRKVYWTVSSEVNGSLQSQIPLGLCVLEDKCAQNVFQFSIGWPSVKGIF